MNGNKLNYTYGINSEDFKILNEDEKLKFKNELKIPHNRLLSDLSKKMVLVGMVEMSQN